MMHHKRRACAQSPLDHGSIAHAAYDLADGSAGIEQLVEVGVLEPIDLQELIELRKALRLCP